MNKHRLKSLINLALALRELSPHALWAYARYRLTRRSGALWRRSQADMQQAAAGAPGAPARGVLRLPSPAKVRELLGGEGLAALYAEADAICAGRARRFAEPDAPLDFRLPMPPRPWPAHEAQTWIAGLGEQGDIKFLWEPARFGWAITLARAYHLSGAERYAAAFWEHTAAFMQSAPPGWGPQWASAQEVGLRLISLCLAWEVFAPALSPAQAAQLAVWLAQHAGRIPCSLDYARAQNNNHLLSEAAALYSAGTYLPEHPQAAAWRAQGRREFGLGLLTQLAPDGVYIQHSLNYHRLMLQLALWMQALGGLPRPGETAPKHTEAQWPQAADAALLERLSAAAAWLGAQVDPASGGAPNLGPNDGAYILPFTSLPYADQRPALQAAALAFMGQAALPPGAWDEMGLWFGLSNSGAGFARARARKPGSWASLRVATWRGRPGHADQLHVELWQGGLNLACDPGTYLYNAPPPWDNRLTPALVHNTLTIDGQDQMRRAGRFLYVGRAEAELTERQVAPDGQVVRLAARSRAYQRLGLLHERSLEQSATGWIIYDRISGQSRAAHTARLHWLMPDLPWALEPQDAGWRLALQTPSGRAWLSIQAPARASLLLTRAGEAAWQSDGARETPDPVWGWYSPTYGSKIPALSLAVTAHGPAPLEFTSLWQLPE